MLIKGKAEKEKCVSHVCVVRKTKLSLFGSLRRTTLLCFLIDRSINLTTRLLTPVLMDHMSTTIIMCTNHHQMDGPDQPFLALILSQRWNRTNGSVALNAHTAQHIRTYAHCTYRTTSQMKGSRGTGTEEAYKRSLDNHPGFQITSERKKANKTKNSTNLNPMLLLLLLLSPKP